MSSYKQSSISDLISAWKITILFFLSSVLSEEHSLLLLPALFIPAAIGFRAPVSGSTRLCLNHICLLTKSSRCLHCHEHHPQFKLCTTDQPEIISVLPTLQCLISCIISHTHVIMTQVSPTQNQNSFRRNPGKQTWSKQIWASISLHVLGKTMKKKYVTLSCESWAKHVLAKLPAQIHSIC